MYRQRANKLSKPHVHQDQYCYAPLAPKQAAIINYIQYYRQYYTCKYRHHAYSLQPYFSLCGHLDQSQRHLAGSQLVFLFSPSLVAVVSSPLLQRWRQEGGLLCVGIGDRSPQDTHSALHSSGCPVLSCRRNVAGTLYGCRMRT